jgi:F-type H+-transporting ATPase subunit gamma
MATIKSIQKRIKSAKNISQITKAMQMVAAARMKKAQNDALAGKPYQEKIEQAVSALSSTLDISSHPLLKKSESLENTLIILISTNKGLCGSLNTTLFRKFPEWFSGKKYDVIVLGKKAESFAVKSGFNLVADYSNQDYALSIPSVSEFAVTSFIRGTYDQIFLVFNEFINTLKQAPLKRQLLPLEIHTLSSEISDMEGFVNEFIIEPSRSQVLESLLPHYVEIQIRSSILEALASEHSARMIAMKNATENANGLISDLTLAYNKLRQEKITYEIADMITARFSMN